MPSYLSPGVYVEEVASGSRPIEGVGTSVAAFVGLAPTGPLNEPTLVTNWTQYVAAFGDFTDGYYLAHSVYGFFNNGGTAAYVVRVGGSSEGAQATSSAGTGHAGGVDPALSGSARARPRRGVPAGAARAAVPRARWPFERAGGPFRGGRSARRRRGARGEIIAGRRVRARGRSWQGRGALRSGARRRPAQRARVSIAGATRRSASTASSIV